MGRGARQNQERSVRRWPPAQASSIKAVLGSALLWSWGFCAYLSPALFPGGGGEVTSTGLEYGFFASQAATMVFALAVMGIARRGRVVVRRPLFLVAAVLIALTSLAITWALSVNAREVVIACGIVDGFCVPMMGVAWGARYSLGSRSMQSLIVLSFLVAYLLYLVIAQLPHVVAVLIVFLLPLVSWGLWMSDARSRHEVSSDVFPVRSLDDSTLSMPGELTAGSWEAQVLPWRWIGVLIAASFIGNLITSVVMGRAYAGVESLFFGGIAVCACIATMVLVPVTSDRSSLSVSGLYRITLTFTVVGLVAIMVFGSLAIPVGGALVQGSAFFLQVLVFLVITQSTQEQGLSPLLSFSVGQALIAGVVFLGNVVGKQVFDRYGSGDFVLSVVCGCGVLALFFMVIARVGSSDQEGGIGDADQPGEIPSEEPSFKENVSARIDRLARDGGLTKRETEVFGYLAKGRSLPYISDALFVTTGTVKTHTVHIYRKLGVNSKQELLDLIEVAQPTL